MASTSVPASPPPAATASRWPTILFFVTVAAILAMTWQQAVGGSGDPFMRTAAFLIPMLIPVGMAYWGLRARMVGPALGSISMAALFWLALLIGGGQ